MAGIRVCREKARTPPARRSGLVGFDFFPLLTALRSTLVGSWWSSYSVGLMVGTPEYLLLLIGALLLLGILATKLSPHLGVPALALFMAAGMLAGPEGPGRIAFHD